VLFDDQGRDRGLPAKQREPEVPLLLIADELPTMALAPIVVTKAGHAGREPTAACQQAPIDSLGPRKIWHRTFSTRPAGPEAWTQVVAEFASA
jgi:hypothetical protein